MNQPRTETSYAWSDSDGNFIAVPGIPPATDPLNAVKVSIVATAKSERMWDMPAIIVIMLVIIAVIASRRRRQRRRAAEAAGHPSQK